MSSEGPNQHITESLDHYLQDLNMKLAVMLTGDWGAGKTHFIKDFIEKKNKNINDNKILYLSLFGEESSANIANKILSENQEKFSTGIKYLNRGIKTTNIAAKFLTKPFGIDFDGEDGDELEATVEDLLAIAKLEDLFAPRLIKNKTIVFDDIERCKIPSHELFGYLNKLLEHKNCKLILVCNEEKKISEAGYTEVIEKIVFQRLNIVSNVGKHLDSIILRYKNDSDEYEEFLIENSDLIIKNFNAAGRNNCRSTEKLIFNFYRIYKIIDSEIDIKQNKDALGNLFEVFCILSFFRYSCEAIVRICLSEENNKIPISDIFPRGKHNLSQRPKQQFTTSPSKKTDALKELMQIENIDEQISAAQDYIFGEYNKNRIGYIYKDILPRTTWKNIILDEIYDKKEISLGFLGSKLFRDENLPSHILIRDFIFLNNNDFINIYNQLLEDIRSERFKSPFEVSEIIWTLDFLENKDLVSTVNQETLDKLIKTVENQYHVHEPYNSQQYKHLEELTHSTQLAKYRALQDKILAFVKSGKALEKSNQQRYALLREGDIENFLGSNLGFYRTQPKVPEFTLFVRSQPVEQLVIDMIECLMVNPIALQELPRLAEKDRDEARSDYLSWSEELLSELQKVINSQQKLTDKLTIFRLKILVEEISKKVPPQTDALGYQTT